MENHIKRKRVNKDFHSKVLANLYIRFAVSKILYISSVFFKVQALPVTHIFPKSPFNGKEKQDDFKKDHYVNLYQQESKLTLCHFVSTPKANQE